MARSNHTSSVTAAAFSVHALFVRLSLLFFVLTALALMVYGKVHPEAVQAVRTTVADATTPVLAALAHPAQAYQNVKARVSQFFFVYQENATLRKEVEHLRRLQERSLTLQAENEQLRQSLQMLPKPEIQYVTARLVGDTGGPFTQSALIYAGWTEGVEPGHIVMNQDGLVGQVIERGRHSARVMLITDIRSKIPVMSEQSRERGILVGDNDQLPLLRYISDNHDLRIGERIVTSGDGAHFPAGIIVGNVEQIDERGIRIRPMVDWYKLEYVTVASRPEIVAEAEQESQPADNADAK